MLAEGGKVLLEVEGKDGDGILEPGAYEMVQHVSTHYLGESRLLKYGSGLLVLRVG